MGSAQMVRPGVSLHKNWSVSAEQNILGSDEYYSFSAYNTYRALCGYNINPLSGKKTGFVSLFDMANEDTLSYIQNPGTNTNVFYSVAITDAIGGSGTGILPVVCGGYEESLSGDKDIFLHYEDFPVTLPYKSNNDLIIPRPFDQEVKCVKNEFSSTYWACGYSESGMGNKDFWFGKIDASSSVTSLMWDTTYGGVSEDILNSISFSDGHVLFTGYTTSSPSDGTDIHSVILNEGDNTVIYDVTYQLPGDQVLNSASNCYANTIAVGYSDTTAGKTNKDILIVCFDSYNGNVIWTQTVGTPFNDEAFSVREAYYSGNQNYIVAGYTTSVTGDKQNYVVMFDYSGNIVSQRIFGDQNEDECINTLYSLPDGCQFYLFGQQDAEQSFNEIVALNYNMDVYNSTCNGYNDAQVSIYPANGYGWLYSTDLYDTLGNWVSGSWDTYNLSPGKYYMEITYGEGGGKSGCYVTDSVYVSEPQVLIAVTSSANLDCSGNLGNITAIPSGGTAPYYYSWNDLNSQTTATAIDLNVGDYNVTVTDDNGCTTFASQLILQSPSPAISVTSSTNINCYGANNGSATASATGGTPPYAYVWNDPMAQSTAIASNLSSGSYIVNVTDINGCSASATVTITQPTTVLAASATNANISCYGGVNGSATVSASGGTPGYTYLWNDAGSQTGATAYNLLAGNYTVTVTDLNGCTASANAAITQPASATSVSISSSSNVTCKGGNDGVAIASAIGGTPGYTYVWNDPLSQSGAIATNLLAGIYVVNVTDLNGCTAYVMVTITQPSVSLALSITSFSDVSCFAGNDGSATASVIGGTPGYTFLWNDPGAQTGITADNLTVGTYLVYVSDANGCNTATTVTINQPATALSVNGDIVGASCTGNDGQVQISTSGGTPAYLYLWDDLTTNSNNFSLSPGTHYLTVTDANGCTFNGSYVIPYASSLATLRGTVTYSGGYISTGDGKATLFVESDGTGSGQFDTLTYQTLTSAGYDFTNLLPGRYFLKVDITNPALYPNVLNTYYNNGILWVDADTINLSCNDLRYAHVQMHEVTLAPVGNCDISGNIAFDTNGKKSIVFTKGGKATGEPVPGAEILIEQEPNDVPVQTAFTGQDGAYTLSDIPIGSDYHLIVDIPGYPMLSTFVNITVNSNDTLLDNYNFILDTTSGGGIFIDTASGVTEQFIESGFKFFNVYPNPVSEFMFADFELSKENSVSIELLSETGDVIKQLLFIADCKKGTYNYRLNIPSALSAGSYFIRLKDDKNVYAKKIILKK